MKNNSVFKCTIGVIGSGKDYFCKEQELTNIKISQEIQEVTWKLLGITPPTDPMEYEKFYEDFKASEWCSPFSAKLISGRFILQQVGDFLKNIDPRYLIKIWNVKVIKTLCQQVAVCCTDTRMPDEVREALDMGAKFVFCNYKSDRYNNTNGHKTEKLAQYITNLGTYKHRHEFTREELEEILVNFEQLNGVVR